MRRVRNSHGRGELKSHGRLLGLAEYQVGFWVDADGVESGAGRIAVEDCRHLMEDGLTLTVTEGDSMSIRVSGHAFGLNHAEFSVSAVFISYGSKGN